VIFTGERNTLLAGSNYASNSSNAISMLKITANRQGVMQLSDLIQKMNKTGASICRLPDSDQWALFDTPVKILIAEQLDAIPSVISKLEESLNKGHYAAGFISYEAAPIFDSAYRVKPKADFPLCWFAVYDSKPKEIDFPTCDYTLPEHFLTPKISKNHYNKSIDKILQYIENGDIYQANNTIRAFGSKVESPAELFLALAGSHPVPYACYVNTGNHKIVSISPELFLEKNGDKITSFPMKGTASRDPQKDIDDRIAENLSRDEKNCAENVMIVDMVRNDFGRVCKAGSIFVDPLFHVDTYQTLHQMISKVHGTLNRQSSLMDILKGTFPAASITGAPKIRAMEVIEELECSPRNVYTGSMGCFTPSGDFCLNVAIRTLICSSEKTELGIGSGIVADSTSHSEWDECLLKSEFASHKPIQFQVLETFAYSAEHGFEMLDQHLKRAEKTQAYFKRTYHKEKVESAITDSLSDLISSHIQRAKMRLLIDQSGDVCIEKTELKTTGWGKQKLKIAISADNVDSKNIFLYHKTTNREFYNTHFKTAIASEYDEVVFVNEKGYITEGSISNIFIRKGKVWFTPPVHSGLLAGIWRANMIKQLNAKEQEFSSEDLIKADEVIIGNSVRGTGAVTEIINEQPSASS